jgi:hypothetical protein
MIPIYLAAPVHPIQGEGRRGPAKHPSEEKP